MTLHLPLTPEASNFAPHIDALFNAMLVDLRDRRTAWVPTFAPVQAQVDHADAMGWSSAVVDTLRRILEQHAASLVRAHVRGVIVVAGSDA